jgi:hypothetical protein
MVQPLITVCFGKPRIGFAGSRSWLRFTRIWRCTNELLLIALLVCTSIPVSRKKFLIMTHPPLHGCSRRNGLVARTSTHAPCQILLCQPVVTNHNSFSVCPSLRRGDQSRITHGTTINPVSGDSDAPFAGVRIYRTSGPRLRITSYRLPLLLNKKGYKYMLPEHVPVRRSWWIVGA